MSDIPGSDELCEAACEEDDLEASEWRELEEILDGALSETVRKVEDGRVRDPDKEKVRIKWVRALISLVTERRHLLEQRQQQRFEAIADRLDEIEEAHANSESDQRRW